MQSSSLEEAPLFATLRIWKQLARFLPSAPCAEVQFRNEHVHTDVLAREALITERVEERFGELVEPLEEQSQQPGCRDGKGAKLGIPGGSVRGERANFTRPVLGCIEANFARKYSLE